MTSVSCPRPCGPMDKASDYGSGDSRFESWQGRILFSLFLKGFSFFSFLFFYISFHIINIRIISASIIKPRAKMINVNGRKYVLYVGGDED